MLKQQEMIYYHHFYVESLYPENRRRILRWLFRSFVSTCVKRRLRVTRGDSTR